MKTKIIYISGNELFDMREIRNAFEEVRQTLGLDKNTILFGVPVDNDDALVQPTEQAKDVVMQVTEPIKEDESKATAGTYEFIKPAIPEEPVIQDIPQTKKVRKSQKKKEEIVIAEPEVEIATETAQAEPVVQEEEVATVIPIISVLSVNDNEPATTEAVEESQIIEETEEIEEIAPVIEIKEENVISVDTIVEADVPDVVQDENDVAQRVSIDEVGVENYQVAEEIPMEKTLEHLLESMAPLGEDIEDKTETNDTGNDEPTYPDDDPEPDFDAVDMIDSTLDTDATLEQLANEFAQAQSQIQETPKTTTQGKIAKLKDILPFKKKREEPSIMGDLFGWAGIAANDDDVSIPGFFTSAVGKK